MDVLARLARAGVVPVVVLEDAGDAVPTAKAMLAGGVDVMEITFRTAAAPDAIKAVAENCPDVLVGAGMALAMVWGFRFVTLGEGKKYIPVVFGVCLLLSGAFLASSGTAP